MLKPRQNVVKGLRWLVFMWKKSGTYLMRGQSIVLLDNGPYLLQN